MLRMFSRARDMAAEAPMGARRRCRSGVTTRMLLGGTATQSGGRGGEGKGGSWVVVVVVIRMVGGGGVWIHRATRVRVEPPYAWPSHPSIHPFIGSVRPAPPSLPKRTLPCATPLRTAQPASPVSLHAPVWLSERGSEVAITILMRRSVCVIPYSPEAAPGPCSFVFGGQRCVRLC